MSTANYETSLAALPTKNEPRRPYTYDTPLGLAARRRSPSPGPSSRRYTPYDSYVPPRPSLPDFPNSYRPNTWRPPRPFYSRSPSPDRYEPSRGQDPDSWDRTDPWDSPAAPSWPERRTLPPRPLSLYEPRREIIAQRMFEPSDAWKVSHNHRSYRPEPISPSSRYPDLRWDSPIDRNTRATYSPPYHPPPGGDRYRPSYSSSTPAFREPYLNPRSDSYRPNYDDVRPWDLRGRDPPPHVSPSRGYRADLNASSLSSHGGSPHSRRAIRDLSIERSLSSASPRSSMHASPTHSRKSFSFRESASTGHPDQSIHNDSASDSVGRPSTPDESPRNKFKSRSPCSAIGPSGDNSNHRQSPCQSSQSFADTIQHDEPINVLRNPASLSEAALKESSAKIAQPYPSPPQSRECDTPAADGIQNEVLLRDRSPSCSHDISRSFASTPNRHDDSFVRASSIASSAPSDAVPHDASINAEPSISVSLRPTALSEAIQPVASPERSMPAESSRNTPLSLPPPLPSNVMVGSNIQLSSRVPPDESPSPGLPSTERGEREQGEDHVTEGQSPSPIPSDLMDIDQPPSSVPEQSSLSVGEQPLEPATLVPSSHPEPEGDLLDSHSPDAVAEVPVETDKLSDHLPRMSDAKSTAEALRIVVRTRIQCDRQTREERVNPVLLANRSIVEPHSEYKPAADALMTEFLGGNCLQRRMDKFTAAQPSLVKRFADRQAELAEKTQRLRDQYQTLHDCWIAHCARLDNSTKTSAVPDETVTTSGRTTRRSTAVLGDAVRSDLEMEQIIASLGIDELTDPNHLAVRNVAQIPDMISVTRGQVDHHFDDTNNLVEDPVEFYDLQTGANDWTETEKEIFLEKFAAYPKQFGVIAAHLPNKTASQCVAYYYLHKKQFIDFRKVVLRYAPGKRRRGGRRADKQKGNALLADIRKHDDEVSRGAASNGAAARRRRVVPPLDIRKPASARRIIAQLEDTPVSTPTPDPEPEGRPKRRRGRASAAQEEDEDDATDADPKVAKKSRRSRKTKTSTTANPLDDLSPTSAAEMKFADQSEITARRKSSTASVQWSDDDKSLFLALLAQHGDDFKRIAASMPNKTTIQVSNYYKSNSVEWELEKVAAQAPKRSPTPEIPRGTWKEVPQFPGSGVMSPVSSTTPSINGSTSMSSLNAAYSDASTLPAQEPPIFYMPSNEERPSSSSWFGANSASQAVHDDLVQAGITAIKQLTDSRMTLYSPVLPHSQSPVNKPDVAQNDDMLLNAHGQLNGQHTAYIPSALSFSDHSKLRHAVSVLEYHHRNIPAVSVPVGPNNFDHSQSASTTGSTPATPLHGLGIDQLTMSGSGLSSSL